MSEQRQGSVERLLGLILVQLMDDAPQRDKAERLSMAGFGNIEIAALLSTTPAVVSQQLYAARATRKQRDKTSKDSRGDREGR